MFLMEHYRERHTMIRELGLTAVAIVPYLERLLASGSAVPLAAAALVVYIFTIGRA
jgi:hypothetical protein